MMARLLALGICCAAVGGCTGQYYLTVPDQVAPAGGEASTVVRLQRSEVVMLALPVENGAIRLKVEELPDRGAYTDKLGYAGTTVPVPHEAGRYKMLASYMDKDGDELSKTVPVYVWDIQRTVIAVDLDSLPPFYEPEAKAVKAALGHLSERANLCYMTSQLVDRHAGIHKELAQAGYPDGPVLLWQQQNWHVIREGPYNLPRMVIEDRLVSQLGVMRRLYANFRTGISSSAVGAKGFLDAGLQCVVVGAAAVPGTTQRASWKDLATKESF